MFGSGKVEFSDGWRVQAILTRIDAPLQQVMALLDKPVELTGVISAKGVLSGNAETLGALKDKFRFSGEVLISHATARIGGVLDTDVKGTVGLVSMPMVISGTLSEPVV